MILRTVQSYDAYKVLLDKDELITDENSPLFNRDFIKAYKWIGNKMKCMKVMPSQNEKYPLWAWKKWEGKDLDLDLEFYKNSEKKYVLLTIDIDDKDILLSDFDLFHYVINYWYLPSDEKDEECFEKECMFYGYSWDDLRNFQIKDENMLDIRRKIEESWDRIFLLHREDDNIYYGKNSDKSIQATFWRLSTEQTIDVKYI